MVACFMRSRDYAGVTSRKFYLLFLRHIAQRVERIVQAVHPQKVKLVRVAVNVERAPFLVINKSAIVAARVAGLAAHDTEAQTLRIGVGGVKEDDLVLRNAFLFGTGGFNPFTR